MTSKDKEKVVSVDLAGTTSIHDSKIMATNSQDGHPVVVCEGMIFVNLTIFLIDGHKTNIKYSTPSDIACPSTTRVSTFKSLSFLDRFLAIWIFLSMALGIILGYFVPELPSALQKGEFAGVSIPICIGLLVMMYPILCKVQYETLHLILKSRGLWVHFSFSIALNWIVAPLFMVCSR